MDILKIEATDSTPEVVFNADESFLSIRGASRPENVQEFYGPLKDWLEEYRQSNIKMISSPLNIEVKFLYFNSPSIIEIIEIFKIVQGILKNGNKVLVNWYYDRGDEVIYETAQDISDITEIPFIFFEE